MPTTRDALIIAVLFLVPGFIGDGLYGRNLNRPKRDPTELLLGVLVWSFINYVLCAWLVVWLLIRATRAGYASYAAGHIVPLAIIAPLILLVAPAIEALAFRWLIRFPRIEGVLARVFLAPARTIPKAWDYVFTRQEDYLVLITLSDGTKFGVGWGRNSFASSFPNEEDIYFEVVYSIDDVGKFGNIAPLTRGLTLKRADIRTMEFFIPAEEVPVERE